MLWILSPLSQSIEGRKVVDRATREQVLKSKSRYRHSHSHSLTAIFAIVIATSYLQKISQAQVRYLW